MIPAETAQEWNIPGKGSFCFVVIDLFSSPRLHARKRTRGADRSLGLDAEAVEERFMFD